jgi:hypothetical protein
VNVPARWPTDGQRGAEHRRRCSGQALSAAADRCSPQTAWRRSRWNRPAAGGTLSARISHDVIINTIGAVRTATGLTVTAVLDHNPYPTGIQVSDQKMRDLEDRALTRHGFHGEQNYTLDPVPARLPLTAQILATIIRQRHGLPLHALAYLTGVSTDTLTAAVKTTAELLRQHDITIPPARPPCAPSRTSTATPPPASPSPPAAHDDPRHTANSPYFGMLPWAARPIFRIHEVSKITEDLASAPLSGVGTDPRNSRLLTPPGA